MGSRLVLLLLGFLLLGVDTASKSEAPTLDCTPHLPVLSSLGLVKVEMSFPDGPRVCSGAAISPTSILTAKHCIGNTATVVDLSGARHKVVLAIVSQTGDIALLKLDTPVSTYFRLAESSSMGLMLEGFGCSADHNTAYQRSAILRSPNGDEAYLSGCVCFGDSGGPVLNNDGELVGLMIRTYDEEPYRGKYAVMIQVKAFVDTLPPLLKID